MTIYDKASTSARTLRSLILVVIGGATIAAGNVWAIVIGVILVAAGVGIGSNEDQKSPLWLRVFVYLCIAGFLASSTAYVILTLRRSANWRLTNALAGTAATLIALMLILAVVLAIRNHFSRQ